MSLQNTPRSGRIHIAFFGDRNAGKSSLVNAVTGQSLSVVSNVKGTTTDPVYKAMELLPLGPVMMIDTPGFDDEGFLGELRVEKTNQVIAKTDIGVLVVDAIQGLSDTNRQLISMFKEKNTPYLVVYNKADLLEEIPSGDNKTIYVSANTGLNIETLKNILATQIKTEKELPLVHDLIKKGGITVLVTPIDASAPKGRLILPQQLVIRDLLDHHLPCVVTQPEELPHLLTSLKETPALVITDSQAFGIVSKMVPPEIPLTSFSILMARQKGFLETAVQGAYAFNHLKDEDTILIAEGCTHHRQCEDIGTVKLPKWISAFTGKQLNFRFTSGTEFPSTFKDVALVVHCGGCMLNNKEVLSRMNTAVNQGIPFTNYGTAIAHINGILKRSLSIFPWANELEA